MTNLKTKTCCFTGHRKIPPEQLDEIVLQLRNTVENLIEKGYAYFGTGGALGFDTVAAETVLSLRVKYPDIKLILVLPCLSLTYMWTKNDIRIYEKIKKQADKVVHISKEYTNDCMYRRNRHLINCSSVCVCYKTKETGGTAFTVNYAKEKGLQIINIANL